MHASFCYRFLNWNTCPSSIAHFVPKWKNTFHSQRATGISWDRVCTCNHIFSNIDISVYLTSTLSNAFSIIHTVLINHIKFSSSEILTSSILCDQRENWILRFELFLWYPMHISCEVFHRLLLFYICFDKCQSYIVERWNTIMEKAMHQ